MVYYKKSKKLDLERFPPISSSTLLHIKPAYLQSYVWLRYRFAKGLVIDSLEYDYKQQEDDDEVLKPEIMTIALPEDLPIPCNCGKCARANVCTCCMNNIQCCQCYNCKAGT